MKTIAKAAITALTAIVMTIAASAQTQGIMLTPQSSEIIAPTPSSAQQMRYQSPQPTLATGAVNLSINLYNLEIEGFSIPFTLKYETSGIKPCDDPYPCGYGWSFLPALKVTRTIRGRADELYEYKGQITGEFVSNPTLAFAAMVNLKPNEFESNYTQERYDTEKDLFSISLPSGTYKRMIVHDNSGTQSFLFVGGGDDDEVVISGDPDLSEIRAVDSNGVVYLFGTPYETFYPKGDMNSGIKTSWSLKSIILPSGREITLQWERHLHDSFEIGGNTTTDSFSPSDAYQLFNNSWTGAYSGVGYVIAGRYNDKYQLKQVLFPNGCISLQYIDKKLVSLEVQNSDGDIVRKADFDFGTNQDSKYLQSVSLIGEGIYRFSYNPTRFDDNKMSQDWWGYYNGQNTHQQSLTPKLFVKSYTNINDSQGHFELIGKNDRRPDADAMKAGILTKVTYPTGGTSEFEYEPHRFAGMRMSSEGNIQLSSDPLLDMGGGLRVVKITTKAEGGVPIIRTYTYDSAVVRAVPSAATFVTISTGIGISPQSITEYPDPKLYKYRMIYVSAFSDYMKNRLGEEPIWYRHVTEHYAEGEIEYIYDVVLPPDEEYREWGHSHPIVMNNVFSKGARLIGRKVYKTNENGVRQPVVTEEYEYDLVTGSYKNENLYTCTQLENTQIQRKVLQTAVAKSEAPDFEDGKYLRYTAYYTNNYIPVEINIDMPRDYAGFFDGIGTPYRADSYIVNLQSDRLRSKKVTRHLENGDFEQSETYTYRPGTTIVTAVTKSNPADTRTERTDITYPASGTQTSMYQANMVGVPLARTTTYGSSTVKLRREMQNYGSKVYRPAKEYYTKHGEERLVGSYDYDSFGNIREYRGEDSIPSVYLWGYSGKYPVYRVDGSSFVEVKALGPGSGALGGSAEIGDITSLLEKGGRNLVTKVLWRPLVGIVSQRQPSGITYGYEYDSSGRLTRTTLAGHGPVDEFSYHINEDGLNYTSHSVYSSATNSKLRDITNYDGLGREISRLQKAIFPKEPDTHTMLSAMSKEQGVVLPGYPDNYFTATYTEYDGMDRPMRQWSPVGFRGEHPGLEDIKSAAAELYGTDFAYTTNFFEASPLEKNTGLMQPGTPWHENDKRTHVRYYVNTASGIYSCPRYQENARLVFTTSNYPAGMLVIKEETDEEGRVAMTFTDWRGRTVMTREGVAGDWNDTRYVYNDDDELLYVLQPNTPTSALKTLCFRYTYDNRGNVTSRYVPGGTTSRFRYDKRNRLFAEQDGNMSAGGRWLVHHYDRFGRPAFSAIVPASEAIISQACQKSFTAAQPTAGGINNARGGYTLPSDYPLTPIELFEAHYYDNYGFATGLHSYWRWHAQPAGYPDQRASAAGLETGMAARNCLTLVNYDTAENVIRRATGEMQGRPRQETFSSYNYEGLLVEQTDRIASPQEITQISKNIYWSSGHLRRTEVTQNDSTARTAWHYDGAGRVDTLRLGGKVVRSFAYDAGGRLTASNAVGPRLGFIVPELKAASAAPPVLTAGNTIFSEKLYYATAAVEGCMPRFDGKISARTSGRATTAYSYDSHGRLSESKTLFGNMTVSGVDIDCSTAYTYDRNAALRSITRKGVTDIVGGKKVGGLQNEIKIDYNLNRPNSITVTAEGAEYEGRTGLKAYTSTGSDFTYDANGNMTSDGSRGIVDMKYDRRNRTVEATFADGHRQSITYDGFGNKRFVGYAQGPESVVGGELPSSQSYELVSEREYSGPHIFTDDRLEYSGFAGGYFDAEGSPCYYVTDWQGNNAAVVGSDGFDIQKTTYYPYGEPTVEPNGQRYLFGGKEREHAGGRNSYDFGARNLTPYGIWSSPEPLATNYASFSPFAYCKGDPVNYIDPDGKLVIFINGMHYKSDGGKPAYWNGFDTQFMGIINDYHAVYYDGSMGGVQNLIEGSLFSTNMISSNRFRFGFDSGFRDANSILGSLNDNETIKIVTHSMGAMFAKGFILGFKMYALMANINIANLIELELDLAPFQSYSQFAIPGIKTVVIFHKGDFVALPFPIKGARNYKTRLDKPASLYEHSIESFKEDDLKLYIDVKNERMKRRENRNQDIQNLTIGH